MSTQRKYIKKYVKRNAIITFGIALPVAVVFFIIALIFDSPSNKIGLTLSPFAVSAVVLAVSLLWIIRFRNMIALQEKTYHTVFNDRNAEPLYKRSVIFLSDDWLIFSGSAAFNYHYIYSIKYTTFHGNHGTEYKVKIETKDNKSYSFWMFKSNDIKKVTKWFKDHS